MEMFLIIAIICLLLTVMPDLLEHLKLSRFLIRNKNGAVPQELLDELAAAKEELERVLRGPSSGEYARTIKTMRAQQKIKEVEARINNVDKMAQIKIQSIDVICSYAVRFLLSLCLIWISIWYRYTPVAIFDKSINLQPLTGILSFPTGVHNAISVWIWSLSCNISFRFIYGQVKNCWK